MKSLDLIKNNFYNFKYDFLLLFFFSTLSSLLNALTSISLVPLVYYLLYDNVDISFFDILNLNHYINVDEYLNFTNVIVFFVLFFLLSSFFKIISFFYVAKLRRKITNNFQKRILNAFYESNWHFFYEAKVSSISNVVYRDLNYVSTSIICYLHIFSSFFLLSFLIITPFLISFKLAIMILFGSSILIFPVLKTSQKILLQNGKKTTLENKKYIEVFNNALFYFKTILVFNKSQNSISFLQKSKNKLLGIELRNKLIHLFTHEFLNFFTIIIVLISFLLSKYILIPIPELAALMFSFLRIVPIFSSLVTDLNSIKNCEPSYNNILQIEKKALDKSHNKIEKKINFKNNIEQISFKNVAYKYPNKKVALDNINFDVKINQKVALIGHSGSGKSTILDLIACMDFPKEGIIKINGINSFEINKNLFLDYVGFVDANNHILPTSIYENLKWSNNEIDEKILASSLEISDCKDFVNLLPDGVHTDISDHGSLISAGQKQRICIARALVRKPSLLLLDEATSHLDSITENKVIDNLKKIKNIIIIMATHNEKLVQDFDIKIFLDQGKIVKVIK